MEKCFVALKYDTWSLLSQKKRKSQAGAEPWQSEGCVVWPLLYAALGKTRECGASEVSGLPHQDTSSTINLFLFFFFFFCFLFFLERPFWPLFWLFSSNFFVARYKVLTFFALFQSVSMVHNYVVFLLFCPFWLYVFSAATCMKARILCQWFGRTTAVNIYWVKCHHPYALQTFVDPSNKNYVHKKYFLCMSAKNFPS